MELYHVTTDIRKESIRFSGVDPTKATGKMQASWWVTEDQVVWAMAHVSAKWGVSVDHLVIFSCESDDWLFVRWVRPGVFYTVRPIIPDMIWDWKDFVKPEV